MIEILEYQFLDLNFELRIVFFLFDISLKMMKLGLGLWLIIPNLKVSGKNYYAL